MNIKDSYIHNGEAILKDIQVSGSKLQKLKAGKDANDAYLTWVDVLDLSPFGASGHNHDDRYVNVTGDIMTGLLTTTYGNNHSGIKVGNTYINAINGELIFQNNSTIRFGGDSWDYNVWAGLKYVHASKTICLGLADGSVFTANNAQSGGKLYLPGIDNLYTGNGTNLVWHEGNDGSGSGLDADKLDGYHATCGDNKPWGTIPVITTNGWMDVGKQFEFHYDNTTGSDYSTILRCTGNYSNLVNLPSASGTLALTSQIPTKDSWNYDDRYLKLTGGTMSNTNVVTNLNADLLDGYHAYNFAFAENTYGTTGNFVNGIEGSNYIARGDLGLVGFDNSKITVELYEATSGNSYPSSPTKTINTSDTTYGVNFRKGTYAIMHSCAAGSKLKIIIKSRSSYIKSVGIYINLGGNTVSFSSTVGNTIKTGSIHTYGSWHLFSCMNTNLTSITLELNTTNVNCGIIIGGFRTYITNPSNLRFPGVANSADSVEWNNIIGKPSSFTPSSHTHTFASLTEKPTTISGYGITDGLRRVTLANNVENDFNTFENLTLTGRGDPTTGSSLLNSPWTTQPAGGFGALTYLWSSYGLQLTVGYNSNDIYIRNKYYHDGGSNWSTKWDKILNSSNYNYYSPKLDGTGATGTWSISITGNAKTATTSTYTSNVGSSGTAGTNYITAANVISMYNWYNTITSTDPASNTAIDKWNEIVSFLSGITDTSTLSGILAGYAAAEHTHPYLPTTQVSMEQASNDDWIRTYALSTLRGHVYNTSGLEWQYLFGISSGKIYGSILRTSYGDGTPRIQVMGLYHGTWTNWREVAYDGHTHPYLPLNGGTMTGDISLPKGNFIRSEGYAILGINSSDTMLVGLPTYPLKLRSNGTTTINDNTIIHSGNIGSQSVNYATSAGGIANSGMLDSQEKIDNFLTGNIFKYATFKTTDSNNVYFTSNDGMILSIPWDSADYGAQMAFDEAHSATVKVRGKSNTWGNWYTILHSGNYNSYAPKLDGTGATGTWGINISGNAATATSSDNADKLDGQHGSRYTSALGGSNHVTFVVEGDANTYYPVVISGVSDYYPMQLVNISRAYHETAPDTWYTSTHKGGLTLTLFWNGSTYWDGNSSGGACYCVYKYESYCTMVGGLENSTHGKIVWLRGGGAVYHVHSMNGTSVSVTVHTSTFTDYASRSFAPKTSPEEISVRWPGYAERADYASSAGNAATATNVDWSGITNKPTFTTWSETSYTSTYSLSNAAWTNTISLPSTAGSYILNIASGNSTLTGVFSIGTNDNAKDEISLHLHGNGPRLYARTNGTILQLSSSDTNATSRSVTIKYRRMI